MDEARAFLYWLLHASRLDRPRLPPVLTVHGRPVPAEREVAWPGYAGSRPVRFGNDARNQHQLDTYGWVLDAMWLLVSAGAPAVSRDMASRHGHGRLRGGALARTRRRHLGGTRRSRALRALQAHGVARARPCRADRRDASRSASATGPVESGTRRHRRRRQGPRGRSPAAHVRSCLRADRPRRCPVDPADARARASRLTAGGGHHRRGAARADGRRTTRLPVPAGSTTVSSAAKGRSCRARSGSSKPWPPPATWTSRPHCSSNFSPSADHSACTPKKPIPPPDNSSATSRRPSPTPHSSRRRSLCKDRYDGSNNRPNAIPNAT